MLDNATARLVRAGHRYVAAVDEYNAIVVDGGIADIPVRERTRRQRNLCIELANNMEDALAELESAARGVPKYMLTDLQASR